MSSVGQLRFSLGPSELTLPNACDRPGSASAGANVAFTYSSTPADELATLLKSLRAEHSDVQIEAFQLEASSSASYKALLPQIEECPTLTGSLDISASSTGSQQLRLRHHCRS